MSGSARLPFVLALFFLSGLAALLFETAWTREFAFVFGTSELAVATVLAAYMAGLALGATVAGRWAERVRRPLVVYAVLELGIGVVALCVPWAIRGASQLMLLLFGGRDALPDQAELATSSFALVTSFAILMVPTALMGATLPLLIRHAVRREQEIASRVGLLYAINTAGAVAGTLAAAWLLLPQLGLRGAIWAGAGLNALVALGALALSRSSAPLTPSAPDAAPRAAWHAGRSRAVLPLMLVSGTASFAYEVLWTRLLSQILGSSVHAFATMLASFLVGIALGSALAARLATTRARAAAGLVVAQLGAALLFLAAFAAVDALPALARALGAGIRPALLPNVALGASVLLPGALCIGATFPLAVRLLARGEHDAGPAAARVYAWNTVGAIGGALGAGFLAIPLLGFAATLRLAACTNAALAVAALFLLPPLRRGLALAAAPALVVVLLAAPATPWRILRASPLGRALPGAEVTYYGVGRTATVLLLDDGSEWQLRTNGLPEASIQRPGGRRARYKTAAWLGHLAVLTRPEARSVLFVGLGGATALEELPDSLRSIDAVELEPEVVEANRAVASLRRADPLADPRLRVAVNDARSALLLTEERWDAIVSQPSHPFTGGAAHLYTREFFALAREHLEAEGVFVQWIGLGFVDEALLRSLVATLADVFRYVRVYRPVPSAALFLASDAPLALESGAGRALAAQPGAFAEIGVLDLEDLAAALWLDESGARIFAANAPLNTDDRNRLASDSMRRGRASGVAVPAPAPLRAWSAAELDPVTLVRRLLQTGSPDAAREHARAISGPADRSAAAGFVALAGGATARALRHFEQALALEPAHPAARSGWLLARRSDIVAGVGPAWPPGAATSTAAAGVAEAWRREASGELGEIGSLEPALARVGSRDPLFEEATRLRVVWRQHAGGATRAREALALLDAVLARRPVPEGLLLRARLAALAGHPASALADLEEAVSGQGPRRADLARRALGVLATLPADAVPRAQRERLQARLLRAVQ